LDEESREKLSELLEQFAQKDFEKMVVAGAFARAWNIDILELMDFLDEQKGGTVREIMNSLD